MLSAAFVLMSVMLSVNAVLRTSFVKQQSSDLASVDTNTLSNIGTVGNTIECSCLCSSKSDCGGFYFNEADGSCWSANTGQTTANTVSFYKGCGTPPAITNAVLSAGHVHAGETRTYSCSPGYVLSDVVTADTTCHSDGTWSTPSFDCLLDCGTPPAITNAVLSAGDTLAGETRTYSCSPGYVLRNEIIVSTTCQSDGTWSTPSFDCLLDCGTPPAITNAVVSAGDTHAGETRTYSCSLGYVLSNVVTVNTTCQSDGTWSTAQFDCFLDCGTPPAITNAVLSAGDTHAGEIRSYTCSPGYVLRNEITVDTTCQSDRTWSTPSFECLWDCGESSSVTNVAVSTGDTVEGITRTYTCDAWYEIDGADSVTCQAGSTWSPAAFTCVAVCGTDARCPSGWCQIGTSCYMVSGSISTLSGSLTYCQNTYPSLSAYMVQLETADEDMAVVTTIMRKYPSTKFCFGLHDPLRNDVWRWMATNEPLTHSNWVPGQPSGQQYYVEVGANDNFRWRDNPGGQCQALCEISLQ